jgi:hypothetical protein
MPSGANDFFFGMYGYFQVADRLSVGGRSTGCRDGNSEPALDHRTELSQSSGAW